MKTKPALTDNDRKALNQTLAELQGLMGDIQIALDAGLTEVQPLLEHCTDCMDKIKSIKKTYFPNKS